VNDGGPWEVALFDSVTHALRAERLLKGEGIPTKLIPVPRQFSTECGVCLRFSSSLRSRLEKVLEDKVGIVAIHPL
jgi:hypothetical protein